MALLTKRAFDPPAALGGLVAVELVHEGHRGHAQLRALRLRHLAQGAIERARAQEERRLQHGAVDLALEDAGAHEVEEALDEHLAHPVQAGLERRALAQARGRAVGRIEPRRDVAKLRVVPVTQDQRLRHRVAERADAELQRAAVGDRARDVEADGVFGQIDRLARRREQGEVGRRALEQEVELAFRDLGVARHERQLGIDLPDEQKIAAPARAVGEQVEREVGIAAQAEARRAARALGDELRDHVDAAVEHVAKAWCSWP